MLSRSDLQLVGQESGRPSLAPHPVSPCVSRVGVLGQGSPRAGMCSPRLQELGVMQRCPRQTGRRAGVGWACVPAAVTPPPGVRARG